MAQVADLEVLRCFLPAIDPFESKRLGSRSMDAAALQDQIKTWRLRASLSQAELDEKCGFKPGTVARLEQGKTSLSDEKLVKIAIMTGQDLVWVLMEALGTFYRRLLPLEERLRIELGKQRLPHRLDQDTELSANLRMMQSAWEVVFRKQLWASDRETYVRQLLLELAERVDPGGDPQKSRVKSSRKKKPADGSSAG